MTAVFKVLKDCHRDEESCSSFPQREEHVAMGLKHVKQIWIKSQEKLLNCEKRRAIEQPAKSSLKVFKKGLGNYLYGITEE